MEQNCVKLLSTVGPLAVPDNGSICLSKLSIYALTVSLKRHLAGQGHRRLMPLGSWFRLQG